MWLDLKDGGSVTSRKSKKDGVFCGEGSVISHGDFLAFVFHVTRSLIFHVTKHLIAIMFVCFLLENKQTLPLVFCDKMRCRPNNQQLNNGGHFFA